MLTRVPQTIKSKKERSKTNRTRRIVVAPQLQEKTKKATRSSTMVSTQGPNEPSYETTNELSKASSRPMPTRYSVKVLG